MCIQHCYYYIDIYRYMLFYRARSPTQPSGSGEPDLHMQHNCGIHAAIIQIGDIDHHDCLFTEDDDADADTYDDSDADAAAYGGGEL